jgi:hypothetical protein
MALVVPIVADTSGLARGLKGAGGNLARFGKIAALAIGAGVTAELYKSVKAAAEAEKSTQALRGQLKSLGMSGDVERLQNQFTQLATTLGVDDEAASRAFTTILRLTGDSTKAMDGLNLALDLSANTGFADLEKNAMNVGRAMNGNTRLFKQFGITVDENTTKQEALAIVSRRVQGQAESFGGSATGSFQRFNEAVENLRENIGGPLVIALANVAGKVASFVNQLGAKPTLEAKIKLIAGTITDAAGTGYRNLITWWTTTQKTELPARTVITPSGRQQFDTFFENVNKDSEAAGKRMGEKMIRLLAGVFTSDGRSKIATAAEELVESFGSVIDFWFDITGTNALTSFVGGLLSAIPEAFKKVGPAIKEALLAALSDAKDALPGPLQKVVDNALSAMPKKLPARNLITETVKAAIQDARKQLQSFGSSLLSFMSQKRAALLRVTGAGGTVGPNAAEIVKEERRIEDERFAIEEKAARDALATAEDKTSAQLDLDQLLLDRQQTLRDRALADAEATDKSRIDNLIEQFNRGLISAESFSNQLKAYIGADFGSELGIAFSGAFERELQGVLALVADIANVAGQKQPIAAEQPNVTKTLQQENQRRFDEALADWNADQKRWNELKAKRKKGEITQETLNNFVNRQNPGRPKPARSAYGLAMGGILKKQVFTAGEAGAEAVIPLNSTSAMNMLRDAVGGGGGGTTNVYNLTVNAGLGTDPDELGRTIVESIKRFEKRNGQAFSAPLLSVTQNVAGQTSGGSTKTDFNRVTTLRKG